MDEGDAARSVSVPALCLSAHRECPLDVGVPSSWRGQALAELMREEARAREEYLRLLQRCGAAAPSSVDGSTSSLGTSTVTSRASTGRSSTRSRSSARVRAGKPLRARRMREQPPPQQPGGGGGAEVAAVVFLALPPDWASTRAAGSSCVSSATSRRDVSHALCQSEVEVVDETTPFLALSPSGWPPNAAAAAAVAAAAAKLRAAAEATAHAAAKAAAARAAVAERAARIKQEAEVRRLNQAAADAAALAEAEARVVAAAKAKADAVAKAAALASEHKKRRAARQQVCAVPVVPCCASGACAVVFIHSVARGHFR